MNKEKYSTEEHGNEALYSCHDTRMQDKMINPLKTCEQLSVQTRMMFDKANKCRLNVGNTCYT
jgi:hypothetical protein